MSRTPAADLEARLRNTEEVQHTVAGKREQHDERQRNADGEPGDNQPLALLRFPATAWNTRMFPMGSTIAKKPMGARAKSSKHHRRKCSSQSRCAAAGPAPAALP